MASSSPSWYLSHSSGIIKKKKKTKAVIATVNNVGMENKSPMIFKSTFTIDMYGESSDVYVLIEKLRKKLPEIVQRMSLEEDDKIKTEAINDESADFILAQYSKIMEFTKKEKFDVAVTYFGLVEKLYPEYQNNPRWEEINSTRNMVWDNLAKRGLI